MESFGGMMVGIAIVWMFLGGITINYTKDKIAHQITINLDAGIN